MTMSEFFLYGFFDVCPCRGALVYQEALMPNFLAAFVFPARKLGGQSFLASPDFFLFFA